MRMTLRRIFRCLVFVAAMVFLLSCTKEGRRSRDEMVRTVFLRVSTNLNTKADVFEDPADEEKVVNSLRVYAFTNGHLAGYHRQMSDVEERFLMDLTITGVSEDTYEQEVEFVIIANEAAMIMEEDMPQLGESLTREDLDRLRFIAMNTSHGLPMYHCGSVKVKVNQTRPMSDLDPAVDISGHEDHELLSQEFAFELERPVAKLTFNMARKSERVPEIHVKRLTMLARGTRHYNYLLPPGREVLEGLDPRLNDRPVLDESTTVTVDKLADVGFEEVAQTYLSEVVFGSQEWNIPNEDNSVVLHLEYSFGTGTEIRHAYIYMPEIKRNNWYKVNCIISGEGQIIIHYSVRDWELEEEVEITFDYPTHSYLLPELPAAENPEPTPDSYPVMSLDRPFEAYFQMLYPSGQTWTPTIVDLIEAEGALSNPSHFDYDIEVLSSSDGFTAVIDPENYVANEDPQHYYMIRVIPKQQANVGTKVVLGITYHALGGFDYTDYLLINGSQARLFWPEDDPDGAAGGGYDPSALEIMQIESQNF